MSHQGLVSVGNQGPGATVKNTGIDEHFGIMNVSLTSTNGEDILKKCINLFTSSAAINIYCEKWRFITAYLILRVKHNLFITLSAASIQ